MRKKLGPCRVLNKNTAPDRSKSHQTFQSLLIKELAHISTEGKEREIYER